MGIACLGGANCSSLIQKRNSVLPNDHVPSWGSQPRRSFKKKGASAKAPFPQAYINGPMLLGRSFVVQVGLLIPAVQLPADCEHHGPPRVLNDDGGRVIGTRLACIGECPMCSCARYAVEQSRAKTDVGVEDVRRMSGINGRVLETECRSESFKMETVSSPINFQAVGYICGVAVQFKPMRYTGAVCLEHTTTTGHACANPAGQYGCTGPVNDDGNR
jgi:hypothetical protein